MSNVAFRKAGKKLMPIPFKRWSDSKAMIELEKLMSAIASRVNYSRYDLQCMPVDNFHALVMALRKDDK